MEIKIIINNTILDADKGARFMCDNIDNHFLTTPMDKLKCMKVHYKYILHNIRRKCYLDSKIILDGFVCIKI